MTKFEVKSKNSERFRSKSHFFGLMVEILRDLGQSPEIK